MTELIPNLTPLTTVPNRDEAESNTAFRIAVSQFLEQIAPFSTEFNISIDAINAAVADIEEYVALLSSSVDSAALSAQTAQDVYEALAAASLAELVGGSSSSVSVGTGSKSFTASNGKLWFPTMSVIARSAASPANYMVGEVVSYNVSSGALTVMVDKTGGSGSHTDWMIYPAGPRYADTRRIGDIVRTFNPTAAYLPADGSFVEKDNYPDLWEAMFGDRDWPGYLRPPVDTPPGSRASSSRNVAWRPDGSKIAIGLTSSPYLALYDWNAGDPIKLADPATLPAGQVRGVVWSPDGRYLAVAHDTSPYVTIYDWNTGTPVKIANPATLPTGNGQDVDWQGTGRYLVVAHWTTPYVTIYDWFTGSPVKLANPGTLPASQASCVSVSPDGRWIAVGHGTSPYLTIYDMQSGVPTKITDPVSLPTSTVSACAWSPDSRYLAVNYGSSGTPRIYDLATGLAVLTAFNQASVASSSAFEWSHDGTRLAFGSGSTLVMFAWSAGAAMAIDAPYDVAGNTIDAFGFSPNDEVIALAIGAAPYLQFMQHEGGAADFFAVPTITTTKPATYIKATA